MLMSDIGHKYCDVAFSALGTEVQEDIWGESGYHGTNVGD
jgi:hypothetical protein